MSEESLLKQVYDLLVRQGHVEFGKLISPDASSFCLLGAIAHVAGVPNFYLKNLPNHVYEVVDGNIRPDTDAEWKMVKATHFLVNCADVEVPYRDYPSRFLYVVNDQLGYETVLRVLRDVVPNVR